MASARPKNSTIYKMTPTSSSTSQRGLDQDILVEMREIVEAWIEDTGDKGQFPESRAALQIVKNQFATMAISPEFLDL